MTGVLAPSPGLPGCPSVIALFREDGAREGIPGGRSQGQMQETRGPAGQGDSPPDTVLTGGQVGRG